MRLQLSCAIPRRFVTRTFLRVYCTSRHSSVTCRVWTSAGDAVGEGEDGLGWVCMRCMHGSAARHESAAGEDSTGTDGSLSHRSSSRSATSAPPDILFWNSHPPQQMLFARGAYATDVDMSTSGCDTPQGQCPPLDDRAAGELGGGTALLPGMCSHSSDQHDRSGGPGSPRSDSWGSADACENRMHGPHASSGSDQRPAASHARPAQTTVGAPLGVRVSAAGADDTEREWWASRWPASSEILASWDPLGSRCSSAALRSGCGVLGGGGAAAVHEREVPSRREDDVRIGATSAEHAGGGVSGGSVSAAEAVVEEMGRHEGGAAARRCSSGAAEGLSHVSSADAPPGHTAEENSPHGHHSSACRRQRHLGSRVQQPDSGSDCGSQHIGSVRDPTSDRDGESWHGGLRAEDCAARGSASREPSRRGGGSRGGCDIFEGDHGAAVLCGVPPHLPLRRLHSAPLPHREPSCDTPTRIQPAVSGVAASCFWHHIV